ncbi:MAG TPA: hypothetical protein ENI23_17780 [bacterium]|nr:hypothetical protein [bacterium]
MNKKLEVEKRIVENRNYDCSEFEGLNCGEIFDRIQKAHTYIDKHTVRPVFYVFTIVTRPCYHIRLRAIVKSHTALKRMMNLTEIAYPNEKIKVIKGNILKFKE